MAPAIPLQFLSRICHDAIAALSWREISWSYLSSDDGPLARLLDFIVGSNFVLRTQVRVRSFSTSQRQPTLKGTFSTKNGPSISLRVKSIHLLVETPPSRKVREIIPTWSISDDWLSDLCIRQQLNSNNSMRNKNWRISPVTICNIYYVSICPSQFHNTRKNTNKCQNINF